ncbi:MAG: chemotaxis protein CheB [Burkholderiaceae bacterium]
MDNRLIVIGASAGGVSAVQRLIARLPQDFPAALLMTLHVGTHRNLLPELLSRCGPLRALHGVDGEPIPVGQIRVAPPDLHMVVNGDFVAVGSGPKEHHTRPAIDPLFRSAALAHRNKVVGVVLTGGMDDGTAGLRAIKDCGGIAIVQDPADAEQSDMPASALRYVAVDHCLELDALPQLLIDLAHAPVPAAGKKCVPMEWLQEQDLSQGKGNAMTHLAAIGRPSPFVCPDCGGGLWRLDEPVPPRYRCHTGHAFSLASLLDAQCETTDVALWGAIRALQEREALLREAAVSKRSEHDNGEALGLDGQANAFQKQSREFMRMLHRMPAALE